MPIWAEGRLEGKGDWSRPTALGLRKDLLGVMFFTVRPEKLAPGTRVNRRLPAVAEYWGVESAECIPGVVFELYMANAGKGEAGSGKMFG